MPYNGAIMIRGAYPNELYHHGIKGQKWGVRRFQNPDGTLTAAGKKRYLSRQAERAEKRYLNNRRYGTEHDNIHENRKLAEAKDANARAKFWKEQNREAVKSVFHQERKGIWKN